jgi:hypothetical protein
MRLLFIRTLNIRYSSLDIWSCALGYQYQDLYSTVFPFTKRCDRPMGAIARVLYRLLIFTIQMTLLMFISSGFDWGLYRALQHEHEAQSPVRTILHTIYLLLYQTNINSQLPKTGEVGSRAAHTAEAEEHRTPALVLGCRTAEEGARHTAALVLGLRTAAAGEGRHTAAAGRGRRTVEQERRTALEQDHRMGATRLAEAGIGPVHERG